MMRLFHHLKKYAHWYLLGYVFILSWVLALHNIPLYHYKHGFDGAGHVDYMTYIVNNGQLPAAELGWETHQSPIYYWIGAGLISLFGTWKAAQYINIFILWITIGVAIYGLRIIFPKKLEAVLIGAVSLAALPMLNIFPVMVTNELMNTMWSLAVLVFLLKILKTTDEKKYFWNSFFVTVFFVLGYWTKVSIIMISPLIAGVYIYKIFKGEIPRLRQFILGALMLVAVLAACYPVYMRASQSVGPSNLALVASSKLVKRPLDFYVRLDWIPKVDMYTTQYYSLLGGAWNSFFNDGHNVLTPFIAFHKKAFILWSLGFVLFPLSLYGLYRLTKKDRVYGLFSWAVGLAMIAVFIYYNTRSGHYSAVRLTYETPIVLAYAIGIASAFNSSKLKALIYICLCIQMTIMASFYWILPWWHVTKGF